ncbi:MAG: hypothetical protein AAGF93_04320, partial [Cyanobacteria bacterium P01_H01_bin.105]
MKVPLEIFFKRVEASGKCQITFGPNNIGLSILFGGSRMTKITHWRPFGHIERWEPFGDFDTLRKEMDKLFDQFGLDWKGDANGFGFIPSAEMDETSTEIHLKLEVP